MYGFIWRDHCQIQYLKLRALQRQSYTHYFYEATVGAGLPIISTLRGLLETGDKILRIEGIFRLGKHLQVTKINEQIKLLGEKKISDQVVLLASKFLLLQKYVLHVF